MDKGIRQGVLVKFNSMLGELATIGGKKFRRIILDWTVENYTCTMAAASTHYNFALQKAKKDTPEQVVGLGRPEDKNNGGRKKKEATVVPFETAEQYKARMTAELTAAPAGDAVVEAPQEPIVEPVVALVTVVKAKDGTVVAEGLTPEAAAELIEKAKAAKKGALKIAE